MLSGNVVLRIGDETFFLSPEDAAEVEGVLSVYPHRAAAIARRLDRGGGMAADGETLHVRMMMTDRQTFPTTSGVSDMATFNTVRIGDADVVCDSRVAAELERLRAAAQGTADAQAAMAGRGGRLGGGATTLGDAANDARLAAERRNNDPSTTQGAYRARLRDAWQNGNGRS